MAVIVVEYCFSYNLFRAFSVLSLLHDDKINNDGMEVSETENITTDLEIVENLFTRSSDIRHLHVIVSWLQEAAGEYAQQLCHSCELHWSSNTDFWTSIVDGSYGPKLNQNWQLDSLFDECNSLSPQLSEDIDLLYKTVFYLLRAGEFNRARELCRKVGHPWLAAAMGGHKLFEGCEMDQITNDIDVGNRHKLLWQSIAWTWLENALATPDKGNVYERAVFGILCGRLDAVLPVTKTWHDRIWAGVTTYINIQSTKALLDASSDSEECFLPQAYFEQISDISSILEIADRSSMGKSVPILEDVQRCLIKSGLDNFEPLVKLFMNISEKIEKNVADNTSPDEIRFCIHLLLWLKALGISCTSDATFIPLYARYVQILSHSPENVDLAAFYTSQIPEPANTDVYVDFLNHCLIRSTMEGDEDEFIKRALFEAARVGLSSGIILDQLMQRRLSQLQASSSPLADAAIIQSLKWYYAIEHITPSGEEIMLDFLRYSNNVIRMFLLMTKMESARSVFSNIRSDTITLIAAPTLRMSLDNNQSIKVQKPNARLVREYLCYKALFLAFDRLNDWNNSYSNFAKISPEKGEQWLKETVEFKDLTRATDDLVQAAYNVLLFAGPGWLVDEEPDEDTERKDQIGKS